MDTFGVRLGMAIESWRDNSRAMGELCLLKTGGGKTATVKMCFVDKLQQGIFATKERKKILVQ